MFIPLLCLSGCHFLLTGSPWPLWYIEELIDPQQVVATRSDGLVLADGRVINLPCIQQIPASNPLLQHALHHGVEVRDDGEVYGLAELRRICGNDPVVYRLIRVNLTDLAGSIDITSIGPDILDKDSTIYLESLLESNTREPPMDWFALSRTKVVREFLQQRTGRTVVDEQVKGRPGQHDLRSGGLVM